MIVVERGQSAESADSLFFANKRQPREMCPFRRECCRFRCRGVLSVFLVVLLLLCSGCGAFVRGKSAARIKREALTESLQRYLMDFGYMEKSKDGAFALRTEESVRQSLEEMQRFAGVPVTGRLDERTKRLLATPRCGMPDVEPQRSARRKRFTLHGPKWPYTTLSWSLRSKNLNDLNVYEVRYVISKALEVWSKDSRLVFSEVDSDNADILVYFHRGAHGDNFPFDGRGTVLAHAFFPTGVKSSVEVHFDADESWTTTGRSDQGTNLFNVAAHEIGHSLGLSHSNVESALMYPWYKEMENGFEYNLPEDDKQAIQYLYGSRDVNRKWAKRPKYNPAPTTTTTPRTTTTTTTTTARPRASPHRPKYPYEQPYPNDRSRHHPHTPYYPQKPMDPSRKHHNPYQPDWKKTYHKPTAERPPERYNPGVLYPTKVYTVHRPEKQPQYIPDDKYPKNEPQIPTKEVPVSIPKPDTCDTSYDAISVIRREVFIFKDAYFWRIDENGLMPNYPALIRRLWRGLPEDLTHVDAVYERHDGRIVFFVGRQYYVFANDRVENGYPKRLSHLGLPDEVERIDAAMVWGHNGKTYFYSGDIYWKFDEDIQKVELDYPRHMSMWKGVGRDIDAVFQWKDGRTYFFKGKGFWKFDDQHMRVEHEEQKLSAPFWMGCSTNFKEQKSPFTGEAANKSAATAAPSMFTLALLSLVTLCSRSRRPW